jgi:hypothetical protein
MTLGRARRNGGDLAGAAAAMAAWAVRLREGGGGGVRLAGRGPGLAASRPL